MRENICGEVKWTDLDPADQPVQERAARVIGCLAGEEICNLYHTVLVEEFCLKDLNGD